VVSASPEYQLLFGTDDPETAIYHHQNHHTYSHSDRVN